MINIIIGVMINILYWLAGYWITHETFNTLKDVSENLDVDLQSRFFGMTIAITFILLIVYTYMVYKFGWYPKVF